MTLLPSVTITTSVDSLRSLAESLIPSSAVLVSSTSMFFLDQLFLHMLWKE